MGGARLLCRVDETATLISRAGNNLSGSFPELRDALPQALGGHRAILDVGHRDLPSMATTSGRLPLTTRPTGPYRPKETRPWKARPPSDTGRPVTPTCNNQHPNRVSADPPPPTTAAQDRG